MNLKWKSLTLTPVLLAAGIGIAVAGGGRSDGFGGGDHPQRDPAERMAKHLSLDDSQKASVEAIFERNKPARQSLMQRHRAHREAMKSLTPGSANYATRAQALADEAATLARDRVLQRTQFEAELATILTPEQMAKWGEHKARGHHGRWKGKGERMKPESAS